MDAALHATIFWYSLSAYNHIKRMGVEWAQKVAELCSEMAQHTPLWMREKDGEFPQVELPDIGVKSGPYCMAFMSAFLVWTQRVTSGNPNQYLPDSPLLQAAAEALNLWMLENAATS